VYIVWNRADVPGRSDRMFDMHNTQCRNDIVLDNFWNMFDVFSTIMHGWSDAFRKHTNKCRVVFIMHKFFFCRFDPLLEHPGVVLNGSCYNVMFCRVRVFSNRRQYA